jgi:hypothetical protein
MKSRGPYRRHSTPFKLQLCQDIQTGSPHGGRPITNPRLVEQIATETRLKVGGTLYSDALPGPDGPASTYIDMFKYNVETIKSAIGRDDMKYWLHLFSK